MLQTYHRVLNASDTAQSAYYFRQTTECLMLQSQSAYCFRHTTEGLMPQTLHRVLNALDRLHSA